MSASPAEMVFLLPALRGQLTGGELDADNGKAALLVEYACWSRHMVHWRSRRPAARRPVDQEWLDEGRRLFAELEALRATARRVGMPC